jgi:hypothetical protein
MGGIIRLDLDATLAAAIARLPEQIDLWPVAARAGLPDDALRGLLGGDLEGAMAILAEEYHPLYEAALAAAVTAAVPDDLERLALQRHAAGQARLLEVIRERGGGASRLPLDTLIEQSGSGLFRLELEWDAPPGHGPSAREMARAAGLDWRTNRELLRPLARAVDDSPEGEARVAVVWYGRVATLVRAVLEAGSGEWRELALENPQLVAISGELGWSTRVRGTFTTRIVPGWILTGPGWNWRAEEYQEPPIQRRVEDFACPMAIRSVPRLGSPGRGLG